MSLRGNQHPGGGLDSRVSAIGVAAHELKSPLVLLRQLAFELADASLSAADHKRIAEQMTFVTERALRLTSDLTRAESQLGLFQLEPINPLDVASDIRHELSGLYAANGRKLRVKRIRNLPPVIANRDLLRRILLNFADNALHYGDIDGVVELQAQLINERSAVRLSVRDYGPYIPMKQWRKLTGNLEQVKAVHQRPLSSGLGLYISNEFAQAMNGKIGAIRHQDGASFYVELPVSQQMTLL